MGYGDEVMATALAKGAAARGKLIAFGDGQCLIHSSNFKEVFKNNPNITWKVPAPNMEWSKYYKGKRPTFTRVDSNRYFWNYDYKVTPGEFFFDEAEKKFSTYRGGILIEPNVMWNKTWALNKDWGFEKYQALCDQLIAVGYVVWQMSFGPKRLKGAKVIEVPNYRCMAASLASVDLVICPEGGMSHAAAAVSKIAVVIFGGFPAAPVVGFDFHRNLTGGVEGCGSIYKCNHCVDAMKRISVDEVFKASTSLLPKLEDNEI